MAPEVALGKPYNELVDVYSFSVLLWEMLEVETPFSEYHTMAKFRSKVVKGRTRPICNPSWPLPVQILLHGGWSPDISSRPPMKTVVATLSSEVQDHVAGRWPVHYDPADPLDECSSLKSNLSSRQLAAISRIQRKSILF